MFISHLTLLPWLCPFKSYKQSKLCLLEKLRFSGIIFRRYDLFVLWDYHTCTQCTLILFTPFLPLTLPDSPSISPSFKFILSSHTSNFMFCLLMVNCLQFALHVFLGVGYPLEHGWATRSHTFKENWLSPLEPISCPSARDGVHKCSRSRTGLTGLACQWPQLLWIPCCVQKMFLWPSLTYNWGINSI